LDRRPEPTGWQFTKEWTNPAYAGLGLGADRPARRLGCHLTHFVPGRPDDVAKQRALLETATASLQANDAMALGAIEVMRRNRSWSAVVGLNATPGS